MFDTMDGKIVINSIYKKKKKFQYQQEVHFTHHDLLRFLTSSYFEKCNSC